MAVEPAQKEPSILLQRADAVNRCIKELERENIVVKSIVITDQHAVVTINSTNACKKLLWQEHGVIGGPNGRVTVLELKLFGVYVQWHRPFYIQAVKPQAGVH
jgi:hypothetical protein